jgi:four helix bundle protein
MADDGAHRLHRGHALAHVGLTVLALPDDEGAGRPLADYKVPRNACVRDQLLRAVGGISASIEEGYSRSSSRERAHFYEYALGSAREARGWYFRCARALPPELLTARLALLTQIIRILTAVVPDERESNKSWRRRRENA